MRSLFWDVGSAISCWGMYGVRSLVENVGDERSLFLGCGDAIAVWGCGNAIAVWGLEGVRSLFGDVGMRSLLGMLGVRSLFGGVEVRSLLLNTFN
ncbi:hypothetical protein [Anabaena sp. PCC 7108]|uniref:hypothetical protein n=1 Tax=Anabaena sp. PCC 7108 TaxID=163908 RepID=UPI0011818EB9|nr:hypothetical protein [Anabaena sp. PCC 7108]